MSRRKRYERDRDVTRVTNRIQCDASEFVANFERALDRITDRVDRSCVKVVPFQMKEVQA